MCLAISPRDKMIPFEDTSPGQLKQAKEIEYQLF